VLLCVPASSGRTGRRAALPCRWSASPSAERCHSPRHRPWPCVGHGLSWAGLTLITGLPVGVFFSFDESL